MPLETATYISQLVSANPAHVDGLTQGDGHLRLIKSVLQAQFPNFTAAALTSTNAQLDAAVTTLSSLALSNGGLRSYLAGFTLSNDGTLPNSVIDIAAGSAMSDDNTTMLVSSALTKTTGAWVVGSGNGGLDTGTVAVSSWYHVFIIERTDTGVVDALISLSATSPTLPTNYTKKRRIGSFKTDASAHIILFSQNGDEFLWAVPVLDVNVVNLGTTAVLYTLTVPTGVKVNALGTAAAQSTDSNANRYALLTSPDQTDTAASSSEFTVATNNQTLADVTLNLRTNTSAQIRARSATANLTFSVMTNGWRDRRGKDA